jgi:hypothetical protein
MTTNPTRHETADVRIDPLPRAYPLPRPADDDRFTYGLLIDLADLLALHGYPRPRSGADLVGLQLALFGFLYDDPAGR